MDIFNTKKVKELERRIGWLEKTINRIHPTTTQTTDDVYEQQKQIDFLEHNVVELQKELDLLKYKIEQIILNQGNG